MNAKTILIVMLFSVATISFSQEIARSTVGVSGGSTTLENGDKTLLVQHSIGQSSVIGTFTSQKHTARQGFVQPPIEVKKILIDESSLNATLFPNPFTSELQIVFNEVVDESLSILVYDIQGRVVFEKVAPPEKQISLDLEHLSSASYVLLVNTQNKQFKATILKN